MLYLYCCLQIESYIILNINPNKLFVTILSSENKLSTAFPPFDSGLIFAIDIISSIEKNPNKKDRKNNAVKNIVN
ncbi:MAG: hypothetical protein ACI9IL_000160 [Rickettsiales bacterium]|jgi:hypothetical protein